MGGKDVDYIHDRLVRGKDIKYTKDKLVFLTERHADGDFAYELPLKGDGFYVVIA